MSIPTLLNIIACLFIILRIITSQRNNPHPRRIILWLTWLLAVACGSVIYCLVMGYYPLAEWPESIIHFLLCAVIYVAAGDLSKIIK
ncbi:MULTISPECIES: phage holin family protein [Yersiniaceae]|uniref:Phage holin family protein n=2 Tax=Yersiniaceae TaxID=1903411 RepID=A0A2N5EIK8_9GAMM|nr:MULTISPECIES: phage holin family protein [Yersiniaceae]MBS0968182.1 phage holin family protein [Nissabacter archeti]PLR44745.1 hypothetical protein CYR34_18660 [Chimaeribacter arupi]